MINRPKYFPIELIMKGLQHPSPLIDFINSDQAGMVSGYIRHFYSDHHMNARVHINSAIVVKMGRRQHHVGQSH